MEGAVVESGDPEAPSVPALSETYELAREAVWEEFGTVEVSGICVGSGVMIKVCGTNFTLACRSRT